MTEIKKDMLKVKRMVSEVEIYIGKREIETELVNKLIDAENLLTYCLSRLENAIELPCKIGGTVYFYDKSLCVFSDYTINSIVLYNGAPTLYEALCFREGEFLSAVNFTETDIGKTVFLTREEAEKS